VGHPAVDGDAQLGHVRELDGVVLAAEDRLAEVAADLIGIDVERRRELDVRDVVAPEVDVHQPGDGVLGVGVLVVLDPLHERRGAVPHADDRDAHLAAAGPVPVLRGRIGHTYPSWMDSSCFLTEYIRWSTVNAVVAASR
jgi:hypothetical protein